MGRGLFKRGEGLGGEERGGWLVCRLNEEKGIIKSKEGLLQH